MDLQEYINSYCDGNQSKFARSVGITQARISQLCAKGGPITTATAKKISLITNGKVTAHDLLAKESENDNDLP